MRAQAMTGDGIYGSPIAQVTPIGAAPGAAGGHPTARGDAADDPHDKSDKGPGDLFDDPVIWIVLLAALATGVLGVRFHVGSNRVNIKDQAANVVGTTLYAIVGILCFKTAASWIEIPGIQKVAAAI
jgi:hypothetical protein